MDVARFGAFATPRYTTIKVEENYRRRFRLAYPNEELPAARPLRRTPIYDRLKAGRRGVRRQFRPRACALVRARRASSRSRSRPTAAPTPSRIVRAECHAVRTAVGIYETSNYGKYEVTGARRARLARPRLRLPDAEARPDGDRADAVNERGRHHRRSLDRLPRRGPLHAGRLGLRRGVPHALVRRRGTRPTTFMCARPASTLTGFSIAGPNARTLDAAARRGRIVSGAAFKLFAVKETAVGMSPAILSALPASPGELGYEIWVTPDFQVHALRRDLRGRATISASPVTAAARISSLRLEKGYGSFNKDFRPDYTPGETGLDAFVDFAKTDFTGRAAALAETRAAGRRSASSSSRSMRRHADVIGYEVDPEGRRGRRPRHFRRVRPLGRQEHRRSATCRRRPRQ